MAVGDKILEITFDSAPAVNDYIRVDIKVIGSGVSVRNEVFKVTRSGFGQVEINADTSLQAANFANAFNIDFCLTGSLIVTALGNVVRIIIPMTSTYDYFDDVNLSGAFASAVLLPYAVNNVIHRIWLRPIHSTPSNFVNTNYIVTTTNNKLMTESGLNIITNG